MKGILIICVCIIALACNDNLEFDISTDPCKTATVDFFTDHPDYIIIPATFETVTEQVLVKDSYNEGSATFETVTEQVLEREAHEMYRIDTLSTANLETSEKDSSIVSVTCYNFTDIPIKIVRETQYTTHSYQKLVTNGTGPVVPAQYTTRDYYRLATDAELISRGPNDERNYVRHMFTIPTDITIEDYLQSEFAKVEESDCSALENYRVVR